MIFGYGKSSNNITIPSNSDQFILTTFHYFHLIFLLRVTFSRKWFLVETAKSEGEVKTQDKIIVSQKPLEKWEVMQLLGQNPVKLFWRFFNQSLIWFVLAIFIWTLSSNFLATGNPTKSPTRTVSQIMNLDPGANQKKNW